MTAMALGGLQTHLLIARLRRGSLEMILGVISDGRFLKNSAMDEREGYLLEYVMLINFS